MTPRGAHLVLVLEVVLERVGDEREHFGLLVEQQHEREIADPLFWKVGARDELETLHLAEVRRVAEHVDEQQLGHVPVPARNVVLLRVP
jgi:hypothetical protein